jgi:hypothetical protein
MPRRSGVSKTVVFRELEDHVEMWLNSEEAAMTDEDATRSDASTRANPPDASTLGVTVVVRSLSGNVIACVQCSGMRVRELLHKVEEVAPSGPGNTYLLTCGETILEGFRSVESLVVPPAEVVAVTVRLAEIVINSFEQGQAVIDTILDKAIEDQKNGFVYATAVKDLKAKIREVPSETEGGEPVLLSRLMANTAMEYFNWYSRGWQFPEGCSDDERRKLELRRQQRLMTLTLFLGNLYLVRVVGMEVIGQVVYDLIGCAMDMGPPYPDELCVDTAEALLELIGEKLKSDGQCGSFCQGAELHRQISVKVWRCRTRPGCADSSDESS